MALQSKGKDSKVKPGAKPPVKASGANPKGKPQPSSSPASAKSAARDAIKVMGYSARKASKFRDYIALGVTVIVVGGFAVAGWMTEGAIFTDTWDAIMRLEAPGNASRDAAINCANPKNRNTPYCDKRNQQLRTTWDNITRNQDGKAAAFTLHGKAN